jgi:glycine/D-amino acid oxidase-like deaminating enzyme/nitrite reductase/ring-hydroxylating ferredoxin subunit
MDTSNRNTKNGKVTSGNNATFWIDSTNPLPLEKLDENLNVDVVIVGGGIAGISVAYNLLRAGKTVALVEDGQIGSGETGRTSAHLTTVLDERYYQLEKIHGKDNVKLIAESHRKAIEYIETVVNTESIKCDFQRVYGYLFLHPTDKPESLQKELDAACAAGLEVCELQDIPGINNVPGPCLRFSNQAQFHPQKYIYGLAKSIIAHGGQIFTETHASEIDENGILTKEGYRINAKHIVVATNSPVNNKYMMHLSQSAYRTYLIGARIRKDVVKEALWWDTGDQENKSQAYHYVRLQNLDDDFDLLLCGGEDHATGLSDDSEIPLESDRYGILENWVRERFPIEDVLYKWSGQVIYPFDSLGFIGRNPHDKNNIYIVTGDSGNGMTYATIAGMLITDLINERPNKYEKIYSPSRFRFLKAAGVFVEELVGGLASYFKKKPAHRVDSLEEIQTGDGKIVEIDGKKYGAYRDEANLFHIVGAECTHMGCIIKWNKDEKSWDCPCHGSRFTSKGTVINGPANKDLNYHKIHASDLVSQEQLNLKK